MIELDPQEYRKLRRAFTPDTAAIIGASTNPAKLGGRALKFCLERGYGGKLYPVNANSDEVQGVKAYRTIDALPVAPDIAVIAVPAPLVRESLEAAGKKGVKIAIVYGALFAEAGEEGRARQEELIELARRYGMRMIGPNCMGVISLKSGFVASFTTAPEHNDGNGWPDIGSISAVSQSGAIGIQIFAQLRDRGLGLANWISTGNQADIDVADCIAYYAEDEDTSAIAVYMEDASRGLKLVQALELARAAQKPVVILKVGTTPEGGEAAAGHTAALYVEDRAVEDLFAQYGVLRAGSITELIDLVAACNAGIVPDNPNVAAISVSGGGAVMISDAAVKNGLVLPDYGRQALARLKETNSFVNDRNPIDVSAPSMSNMDITAGHLEFGLDQGFPTMIGYISHVPLVPRTREKIMPRLLALKEKYPDQLIAIAMNASSDDRKRLVQSGMAVFDDPVVATEAVAKLVRAGQAFAKPAQQPMAGPEIGDITVKEAASLLFEIEVPMLPEIRVASADAAIKAAGDIGGAVAMKLNAPTLDHRTELGGVLLGIEGEEAVRKAFKKFDALCRKHVKSHLGIGITISPMITDGVECFVGIRNDLHFGPLILLGAGGTMVEIFGGTVFRKAPFGLEEAETMIDAFPITRLLDGWRGCPPVDRPALARALAAMSRLAIDPRAKFSSLEINPLFVRPVGQGVVGADLVVASGGSTRQ